MTLAELLSTLPVAWTTTIISGLAAAVTGWLGVFVATRILRRLAGARVLPRVLLHHAQAPARWLVILLLMQAVWVGVPADLAGLGALRHLTLLGIILAVSWLCFRCAQAIRDAVFELYPGDQADNLRDRQVRTQTTVLARCLMVLIVVVGAAAALMTFPGVQTIGASLLASAGAAGLVIGFAARPVLSNLLAGLQIALAQPIRLDDVVIVEGEWGWVEEITATFVIVRIWDQRRLVVPLNWFIDHPFQNWTRTSADIIGTVFLWVDYRMPLEPLRAELRRLCEAAPEWDGRVCVLQVTEAGESAIKLRALVSSASSPVNWDLRCKIREGLIAFAQSACPEYLPRVRAELVVPPPGATVPPA